MNYVKLAQELGQLVEKKQEAYGDSFGKSEQIFKILYPNGVKPENYGDFLALVRIVDKMFRIATKKDAFGENPFMDIEGYALLARAKSEQASLPFAWVGRARAKQEEVSSQEPTDEDVVNVIEDYLKSNPTEPTLEKIDEIVSKYTKSFAGTESSSQGRPKIKWKPT